MKGIILAGGSGTRLFPATKAISKQMLTVYDKPMIYYPLSILMHAGIKDILIICTSRDLEGFKALLGDGGHLGLSIIYEVQAEPNGLAEAFIIGEQFIGDSTVALILGDNLFYGANLPTYLEEASKLTSGSIIFGCNVNDPRAYGVVELDKENRPVSIEEKPEIPKSSLAVPGLYFFDNQVVELAKSVVPSARGELEITSILYAYLKQNQLQVALPGRGVAWLDTGTSDSLLEASNFVHIIQKRQGLYVACVEEIAFRMGYISAKQLYELGRIQCKSDYGKYLMEVASSNLNKMQQQLINM